MVLMPLDGKHWASSPPLEDGRSVLVLEHPVLEVPLDGTGVGGR
jgi:hypothetical protein